MKSNSVKDILPLTKKFITIKSNPENAKELAQILNLSLAQLRGFTIERFERNGAKSALVYNTKKRPKKFKALLNGHLDIIPGKDFQHKPQVKGDRLYGVGSMDMKGNVAAMIAVFKDMARTVDYPLGLQLVTDEEIGGFDGTGYQVEKGVRSEFVIAVEATNFDIVNKAKGILWAKVSATGKTGHGAHPWNGENAIWKMHSFLQALQKNYPVPKKEQWATTVNLCDIGTSNHAYNKIPDDCMVGLDVRFIPEDTKTILPSIKKLLPKGSTLEVITNEPALLVDKDNDHITLLRNAGRSVLKKSMKLRGAQGSSDARHFTKVNCPGIEFGPVGAGIGSDKEWVSISSLEQFYYLLAEYLTALHTK